MMFYEVFVTEEMKKVYSKVSGEQKAWLKKTMIFLKYHPIGKPLFLPHLFEKKFRAHRLYFVVDKLSRRVLIVAYSNKKSQKKVIHHAKKNIRKYIIHLRSL